ncbi:MAG TPA: HD domain-containing phosphohydrolase [Terriglobales bacterium]
MPARIPILYLILGVLFVVGVVPLYIYGTKVVEINRERLITNERMLQNTVTRSLAEDIAQRQKNMQASLGNLAAAVIAATGGDISADHVNSPELAKLLESFVSSTDSVLYVTLLNADGKGIDAGRISLDAFLAREREHAFESAADGKNYTGQALAIGSGKNQRTVLLMSTPVTVNDKIIGTLAAVIDLQFLINRLRDATEGGLTTYVVDRQGRLVAGIDSDYVTGQDLTDNELVKSFVEAGGAPRFATTSEYTAMVGKKRVGMLGTSSPVPSLSWAVIAQKSQNEAYSSVYEMQSKAELFATLAVALSLGFAIYAARLIATPLQTLAESSRAIARGDFSKRVHVKSRTEIGELAQTFNSMTDDLERFVEDLKRAAEENKTLFLNSIQMLAGAVDEKDPYTRGHSDRVTRYSVLLASEMGCTEEEIEKVRISAQLHDVGKIGIEDRILKKPGALTPEEFEIMKTHTVKGANILRPVEALKEMIPGIELHHESLDGRGYPYGLKGDEIPLLPRIIMVADTFDAMTTNRPYQAAMDPEYVVRIINSMVNTKFDPQAVAALTTIFQRGGFRIHRSAVVSGEQAAAAQSNETELLAPNR